MNQKLASLTAKIVIITGLSLFITLPTFAQITQKKLKQSPHRRTQVTGVLLHKEWSKSTQSYCAHKSDYFVIRTEKGKEIVLHGQGKNTKGKKMLNFAGKKVTLHGYVKTKNIKPSSNPMEQRPVSYNPVTGKQDDSFSCKIFVVQNIRVE